jgi:hypothetical protein
MTSARDVPKGFTPAGGYGPEMPPPVLEACSDPLVPGAPDLRGLWQVVDLRVGADPLPGDHPVWQHTERVEQAADRVVVTAGGVVHDMIADGTFENGVNDVAAIDFTTPIVVAATFEDGALVLRPRDLPGFEVRRWREGDQLVWDYAGAFTARMERMQS